MTRPNPDGWKGGSEKFTFVRTLDGHRTLGDFGEDETADQDKRRNERSYEDVWLNGTDYDA